MKRNYMELFAEDPKAKKALGETAHEIRKKYNRPVSEFANSYPRVSRQSIYNFENGDVSSFKVFMKYYGLCASIFYMARDKLTDVNGTGVIEMLFLLLVAVITIFFCSRGISMP